jgi:hypothetical protein
LLGLELWRNHVALCWAAVWSFHLFDPSHHLDMQAATQTNHVPATCWAGCT